MARRFIMAVMALCMILAGTACNTVIVRKTFPESITFTATDGLTITADLYQIEDENAPYIILFHQAGSSRGEYITIAPKLNEMGFNCLAVDLRSGYIRNEVLNRTADEASDLGLDAGYVDAWPDMVAALLYVRDVLKAEKIIVLGSSYSASLSLIMGSEFPEDIAGILAFSPGEYFEFDDNTVAHYATNIQCPVFITSEALEYYSEMEKFLYDEITVDGKVLFQPDGVKGIQGASVLIDDYPQNTLYWEKVVDFLDIFKASSPETEVIMNLSASGITDLSQVDIPQNVTTLILNRNKISDLSPLKNLTHLKHLNLDGNQISDLSPLEGLTSLNFLRLDSNQISDLSPLKNLTNLTELHLYNNQINDLSPLEKLINLNVLYLDDNQIMDITPLKSLTNLKLLDLIDNNINDWSPVSHLPHVNGRP